MSMCVCVSHADYFQTNIPRRVEFILFFFCPGRYVGNIWIFDETVAKITGKTQDYQKMSYLLFFFHAHKTDKKLPHLEEKERRFSSHGVTEKIAK